jgi:hypothetical protein
VCEPAQLRTVIGISEGIVLADRYRLVRRQVERGIGATWIAADIETGADVWVQFADRGGLAHAAELLRRHEPEHRAIPAVLDTGELRLIVDSRAVAVNDGREAPNATHVEIVIEFVVLKPLTGRALPARITRKALAPAEALALVAGLAGALEPARAEGRSHGWLTADSVWLVRRGGYVIDLALGLAFPDPARIEVDQQVTGYFAPERLAGGPATEAADVFALGWLLYETLIGHAALQAEYAKLVAGAGAVTTVELLALWRERARLHVIEVVDANSPLALLLSACLAERAADRPGLGAFVSGARDAATGWTGVGALVEFAARAGAGAAAAAAVAAAEATVAVAAEVDAAQAQAEAGAAGMSAVSDEVAAALVVNSALGLDATAAALDEAALRSESVAATEADTSSAAEVETVAAAGTAKGSETAEGTETPRHGRHRPMLAFTAVGSVAAIFVIGLVIGYEWGHNGDSSSSATAFVGAANNTPSATPSSSATKGPGTAGSVVVAAGSASAVCATPAAASASASASEAASASASAAPLSQLRQIVQAAESSGGITASTASQLTAAIDKAQAAGTGGAGWNSALSHLSTLIQSGQRQGTIPNGTADELATVLSDLYGSSGS